MDYSTVAQALCTALGGTVYEHPAPDLTPYPFTTFALVTDTELNDSPRRAIEYTFRVECWANDLSAAQAGAEAIDSALHNKELTLTGWSNYQLTRKGGVVIPPELVSGELIYRRGGFYVISIAENS